MVVDSSIGEVDVMHVDYDSWKLAGPPECEEEDMYVSCDGVLIEDEFEKDCPFEGKVTAQVDAQRYYWSCPTCDLDHEEWWADHD